MSTMSANGNGQLSVQNSVRTAIDKFAEHVHAGLHLEKINRCKDDRIRTIRIDQFWRGVVFTPETGLWASLGRSTHLQLANEVIPLS
jgi:hypothetical protein